MFLPLGFVPIRIQPRLTCCIRLYLLSFFQVFKKLRQSNTSSFLFSCHWFVEDTSVCPVGLPTLWIWLITSSRCCFTYFCIAHISCLLEGRAKHLIRFRFFIITWWDCLMIDTVYFLLHRLLILLLVILKENWNCDSLIPSV